MSWGRIVMPEEPRRYRPSIPLFDFMRNYINERVGEKIYRNDLIYLCESNGYNKNTVDTYRSYLTSAGYLMLFQRGIYHVLKEIPHNTYLAHIKWIIEMKRKPKFKKIGIKPQEFLEESEMMI